MSNNAICCASFDHLMVVTVMQRRASFAFWLWDVGGKTRRLPRTLSLFSAFCSSASSTRMSCPSLPEWCHPFGYHFASSADYFLCKSLKCQKTARPGVQSDVFAPYILHPLNNTWKLFSFLKTERPKALHWKKLLSKGCRRGCRGLFINWWVDQIKQNGFFRQQHETSAGSSVWLLFFCRLGIFGQLVGQKRQHRKTTIGASLSVKRQNWWTV